MTTEVIVKTVMGLEARVEELEKGAAKQVKICEAAEEAHDDRFDHLKGKFRELYGVFARTLFEIEDDDEFQTLRKKPNFVKIHDLWTKFLFQDVRCDETLDITDDVPSVAADDGSPEPIKRTMSCPGAPRKARKISPDGFASIAEEDEEGGDFATSEKAGFFCANCLGGFFKGTREHDGRKLICDNWYCLDCVGEGVRIHDAQGKD